MDKLQENFAEGGGGLEIGILHDFISITFENKNFIPKTDTIYWSFTFLWLWPLDPILKGVIWVGQALHALGEGVRTNIVGILSVNQVTLGNLSDPKEVEL